MWWLASIGCGPVFIASNGDRAEPKRGPGAMWLPVSLPAIAYPGDFSLTGSEAGLAVAADDLEEQALSIFVEGEPWDQVSWDLESSHPGDLQVPFSRFARRADGGVCWVTTVPTRVWPDDL